MELNSILKKIENTLKNFDNSLIFCYSGINKTDKTINNYDNMITNCYKTLTNCDLKDHKLLYKNFRITDRIILKMS